MPAFAGMTHNKDRHSRENRNAGGGAEELTLSSMQLCYASLGNLLCDLF